METLIILIILMLLMAILTIGIKELINNNNPLIELILFMLIFSIILVFITLIVTSLKEEPKAIDVLEDILENPVVNRRDKLAAAKLILEYSQGKPRQMIDVNADVNQTNVVIRFEGELDEWSE